jgi:hypothetical protein
MLRPLHHAFSCMGKHATGRGLSPVPTTAVLCKLQTHARDMGREGGGGSGPHNSQDGYALWHSPRP